MFTIIGTSTVDFFVSGLAQIPNIGGDEFTTSNLAFCDEALTMVLGGNGGNTAHVLGKLGASVRLGSAVGQDRLAALITDWQIEAGVDLSGLRRTDQAATSTTTVITDQALNRLAFHHPGASDSFSLTDLPSDLLTNAQIVLISGYPLLPAWRNGEAVAALSLARQHGAITAFDIGPAIGQPTLLNEIAALLPQVDYFLSNAHELAVCTDTTDLEAGIQQILAAGTACAVIKRGADGAIIRAADFARSLTVPGFAVEARFTVGAGDSFNAGFLYGLAQGWDLQQATEFANATAALVVSAARGVLGAPNLAEVQALLAD
jgi:sugar/nucleoside kinase (ribokinase family)